MSFWGRGVHAAMLEDCTPYMLVETKPNAASVLYVLMHFRPCIAEAATPVCLHAHEPFVDMHQSVMEKCPEGERTEHGLYLAACIQFCFPNNS